VIDLLDSSGVNTVWQYSCFNAKMIAYRPMTHMGAMMVLVAILVSMFLGFVGLMGYMMYLTPGPSDRL